MKRILITGISGVGKSTVTEALAARGVKAVDADSPAYSEWVAVSDEADQYGPPVEPGRDWAWRDDRIEALLATEDAPAVVISGTSPTMGRFISRFDHIVLLSAPVAVIAERLRTRTTNDYGKLPGEAARVLAQKESIEPLLRRIATHEIDTQAPLNEVVATILNLLASP